MMSLLNQPHELFFYRGNVMDMQGYPMKESNFNFIVDLIDLYIDLVEEVSECDNAIVTNVENT